MENNNMREYFIPVHYWECDDMDSVIRVWLPIVGVLDTYDFISDIESKIAELLEEHADDEDYYLYEAFEDAMDASGYKWEYVSTIGGIMIRG